MTAPEFLAIAGVLVLTITALGWLIERACLEPDTDPTNDQE